MTGTPAGVGEMRPGDRIVGAIAGFGTLTLTIGEPEA
jgi:fumarylpyruvate hydrolase